jgi:hypothetical protein
MKTTKLAIEHAQDGMTVVLGDLKRAATFKEIDALTGVDNIRGALRRTQSASVTVAENAVEVRQTSEAIKRAADLRLSELLAGVKAPEDVEATARLEGKSNMTEAHGLKIVGGLPKSVIRQAEAAIKLHHRESKNPVRSLAILHKVPPAKRAAVFATLKDVPTLREAVLRVIPDFVPTVAAKPAVDPVVVPKWLRDYQARVLQVVALALVLRGAVEAAIKDPAKVRGIGPAQDALTEAMRLVVAPRNK